MSIKQKGSGWSINLAFKLYKIFGYNTIYYLMYPITFFYFLFSKNVKINLKKYYDTINKPFNNYIYYNHLKIFAYCLTDRFISKKDPDSYNFIFKDKINFINTLDNGAILLLSHFGGWATASNSAKSNNTINIIMKETILNKIKKIENSIKRKNNKIKIIDLNNSNLQTNINIGNALVRNEVLAFMVDRTLTRNNKNLIELNFFNKKITFNKNPFKIAYKYKKPTLAFFSIYLKKKTYEIKYKLIDFDYSLKENDAIEKAIKDYLIFFEQMIIQYPDQWFNLYDYWNENKE